MATDCGVFLPPYDNVTSKYPLAQRRAPPRCSKLFLIICLNLSSVVYFLKELMGGKKKMLTTAKIRTIHVPQYEGLGIKEIRQFLDDNFPEVYEYLPEANIELPKTPKQWIVNTCATVLKEDFTDWVQLQVKARHERVMEQKDLAIVMDPEMAAIFNSSTAVSSK